MRLKDFLEEVLMRESISIGDRAELDWNWYEYTRYAELTSMVDFQCGFSESGVCKKYRLSGKPNKAQTERASVCCCSGCRGSIGHMRCLPNHLGVLRKIAELFDEKTGFWRSGKGCVLPRKHRSLTCLFYRCDTKLGRGHPLYHLERMMNTWWKRDQYGNLGPPKMLEKCYEDGKWPWIRYENLLDMFKKQARKEKQKKKKESK